ncbi:phage scaffolding protein [Vallitalea sp.]|jgi:hypothetical protein|uniref:phage scaffolding protein n=1 Tax=Vallitalea sp. TaxID=1882829 RepID=UPI0025F65B9A|nr:phage scaffolding protein [Vallitalea sp.]MCT4686075.1 phage scaffolding protein [Vallitalea sp.]
MDKLKELLGEELYNQLIAKLGDNKIAIVSDGNYIPKQKFDQLNDTKKQLEEDIKERDTQLKDLKAKAKGNEELETKITELQEANKTAKAEYDEKLAKQQRDFAISEALSVAGAKNKKAVMALLNLDVIKVDGSDLLGLKEQLEKLKESDGYLFGEDGPGVGGREPHAPGADHKSTTKNPWSKEHYNLTEQGRILREDPELAKQLKAQI